MKWYRHIFSLVMLLCLTLLNATAQKIPPHVKAISKLETINGQLIKTEEREYNIAGQLIKEILYGQQNDATATTDSVTLYNPVTNEKIIATTKALNQDYSKIKQTTTLFYSAENRIEFSTIQKFSINSEGATVSSTDTLYYLYHTNGYTVTNTNMTDAKANYKIRIDAQGNEVRIDEMYKYTFAKNGAIATQTRKARMQKYYYNKAGQLLKKVNIENKKIASTYSYTYNAEGQKTAEYITYPKQKRELVSKYFYEKGVLVKEIYYDDEIEEVTEYRYEWR
jgi:hypothetical protein